MSHVKGSEAHSGYMRLARGTLYLYIVCILYITSLGVGTTLREQGPGTSLDDCSCRSISNCNVLTNNHLQEARQLADVILRLTVA